VNFSKAHLDAIGGCLLLLCLVLAYPSIMSALALVREQRGQLYQRLGAALGGKKRSK
jgi:hypothetical protein